MKKKIGFIGLGEMGKWMSLNLLKAGYDVMVSDIDPEAVAFLTDQGAESAGNPSEMAGRVDWALVMVDLSLPGKYPRLNITALIFPRNSPGIFSAICWWLPEISVTCSAKPFASSLIRDSVNACC